MQLYRYNDKDKMIHLKFIQIEIKIQTFEIQIDAMIETQLYG